MMQVKLRSQRSNCRNYAIFCLNYTVQQNWTNLSFFGWHRLILTKVHSLNLNLVSVFLQHPQFFSNSFFFQCTLKHGPFEYTEDQNWWGLGKF